MTRLLTLRFFKDGKCIGNVDWEDGDEVILGRQRAANEDRFQFNDDGKQPRIAFAKFQDAQFSRQHLRITRVVDSKIRITNASNSPIHVLVNPSTILEQDQSTERVLPTEISVGVYNIRIERSLHSLSRQTRFHKDFEPVSIRNAPIISTTGLDLTASVGTLIDQLSTTNSVLQQANTKEELYSKAIVAVQRLIDIDGVAIVDANDVNEVFSLDPIQPSLAALDEIRESRCVRWTPIDHGLDISESQNELECFIGAPIVMPTDRDDEVVAILYAHRCSEKKQVNSVPRQPLTELHGQIFELIACSVAAGLVRMDHQATQGRFQQFFTPALARELMKSDSLLEPCEREVTILFCDIRKFSSISEKLGPTQTSQWVTDVMTCLSDCVLLFDGVLVDYIGDELMAMWGAPTDQPDHAVRACQSACKMIEVLPIINAKWREEIGEETRVGIGINTGMANVGNTGSKYKFKYGPLGDTVNRASRVQGLTKYLRVNTILTGETKSQLNEQFQSRRLGKAKVVNIDKSIELFELCTADASTPNEFASCYEEALRDLEKGNLGTAAELLKSLDFDSPDHPALLIMNEIINRVINDQHSGDFEWEFSNK